MTFSQAIKVCMGKLFVFEGRARRSEFWWFYLFLSLISTAVSLVFMFLIFAATVPLLAEAGSSDPNTGAFAASFGAVALLYVLLLVVSLAISAMLLGAMARRLHDMGQSGHWLWLNLAGLGIVPLIMCILEGEAHTNQWGPDPKANERGFVAHAPVAYPPAPAPGTAQQSPSVPGDPYATQQ
jgi:uncharacterized membrane protein YhaH (DUF805 family)